MKQVKVNSLTFRDLNYSVPDSASEYDRLAKREGACVDSANNNTLYRSTFAEFRYNFLHGVDAIGKEGDENFKAGIPGLEQVSEIKRKTKDTGKTRGEGENKEPVLVWDETETEYEKRVYAELVKNKQAVEINGQIVGPFDSVEAASAAFAPLAQRHLDAIPFDPSERERAPKGPVKVAKIYVTVAQKLVDAGKAEATAAELSSRLGITVEPNVDSLSRAISEDQRRKREGVGSEYGV